MQITRNVAPRYTLCRAILREMAARVLSASPRSASYLLRIGINYLEEMRLRENALPGIGRITIQGGPSFRHDPESSEHLFFDPVNGAIAVAYDLGVGARKKKWYQLTRGVPYSSISASGLILYDNGDCRVEQTTLLNGASEVDRARDENYSTTLNMLFEEPSEFQPWSRSVFEAVMVARDRLGITYIDVGGVAQAAAWHIVKGAGGHSLDRDGASPQSNIINGFFQTGIYLSLKEDSIKTRVRGLHEAERKFNMLKPGGFTGMVGG